MCVQLVLFTFYLNGRLHAVSIKKLNVCQIKKKTESEQNFSFPHIPTFNTVTIVSTANVKY